MRNINYFNPTMLHYGWGRVSEVGKVVTKYGKKCLMVTGSGASLETLREKVTMLPLSP